MRRDAQTDSTIIARMAVTLQTVPAFLKDRHLDVVNRVMAFARIDLTHARGRVSIPRAVAATVVAVAACLVGDAVLVAIGTAIFPSISGYPHFHFSSYGKLTVIGVVFACVGWPIVSCVSSTPRWIYLRLAILASLVLYLPDLYLLARGDPPKAVAVLMVLHLAVILIAYNVMVHLAPATSDASDSPNNVSFR
jgi:hypothetical protein